MKKYSIVLFGLLLCLLIGCSPEREQGAVTQLNVSAKTDAKELRVDTIRLAQEFIHVKWHFVYRDSILVVVNKPSEAVPFIEIRNLTDNKPIGNYIPLGKGPGEMLQVFAYLNGNTLQLNDLVRKQIARINLDSLLQDPTGYSIPTFAKYQVFAFGKAQLADGRWVFENPYAFKHEKSGIVNDVPRLFVGDETTKMEDFGEYKYETSNVSQGMLFTNQAKNRLVYASLNFPIIEFYDGQTSLLKTIIGPDNFENQKFDISQGGVIYHATIPYSYLAYCFDNDHLYLMYVGEMINFDEKSEKDLRSWIFRFDWDGNFVDSYYCPSHISALSVSSDGKAFYATIRDQDNMPVLVKLSGIN